MIGIEAVTEIKPKFPPKVQQIWDDCGTYIEGVNPEIAAQEIEFFVEALIQNIAINWDYNENPSQQITEMLVKEGYLNYE